MDDKKPETSALLYQPEPETTTEPDRVLSKDEHLAMLREVYCTGISEILNRCGEELALPADREAMLHDAAQFLVFLIAMKITEERGTGLDRHKMLAAYRHLEKEIAREVPAMILQFERAASEQGQRPGEPVQ